MRIFSYFSNTKPIDRPYALSAGYEKYPAYRRSAIHCTLMIEGLDEVIEMNSNEYDTQIPWIPPQNQIQNLRYRNTPVVGHPGQQRPPVLPQQRPLVSPQLRAQQPQQGPAQKGASQKPKQPERMPKARTVMLARTLKRWLVIASIVGFGTFSGLAAFHQVGTTTTQAQQSPSKTTQPTSTSSTSSNNGFFNQQEGNNLGSSNSSQGTTSGSNSSSSSSNSSSSGSSSQGSTNGSSTTSPAPVTGSSTS